VVLVNPSWLLVCVSWQLMLNSRTPKNWMTDQRALTEQLLDACKSGDLEEVKRLVDLGADIRAACSPNGEMRDNCAVRYASKNGHLKVVEYLVSGETSISPFGEICDDWGVIGASENGYLDVVKYLVSLGASIRARDNWAVRYASKNGHLKVVEYLVSAGANIKACDDWAIRYASENGHLDVVKYLVSQGAE
jgi:ankyrin repeat protein